MKNSLFIVLFACLAAACGSGSAAETSMSNEDKLREKGKKLGEYFCKMQTALQAGKIDELKTIRSKYNGELASIHGDQQNLAGKQEKISRQDFMAAALKNVKAGINETANKCGITAEEIETFFQTQKLRGEPKDE